MITVIDYGLGNIEAFVNMYRRLNIPVCIAKNATDLVGAQKLILPGVGAFDYSMQKLNSSGMRQAIEKLILEQSVPILGVCVGMQMLAQSSDEGKLSGLGWIKGEVRKFNILDMPQGTCLPHMGWNDVQPVAKEGLFKGMEEEVKFYFLHSYYFECKQQSDILALADYGGKFTCAVQHNNVYGVQFHPEKSHHFGSQLLKNFEAV